MTQTKKTNPEIQQVHVLSTLHYLSGVVLLLSSCVCVLQFGLDSVVQVLNTVLARDTSLWRLSQLSYLILDVLVILVFWVAGGANIVAGNHLRSFKKHQFCRFVANASVIFIPLGTVVCIVSYLILTRPSIAALFDNDGKSKNE